jgi:hypothetical protein
MNRGRYYATVMPIAGTLYVMALIILGERYDNVAVIGATVIPAGR